MPRCSPAFCPEFSRSGNGNRGSVHFRLFQSMFPDHDRRMLGPPEGWENGIETF
ncbi:hypothetical protein WG66_017145 [Moniliophthora roreri]|nr:hypothetical protein WG66_017145 [Moniliophthora roreri]